MKPVSSNHQATDRYLSRRRRFRRACTPRLESTPCAVFIAVLSLCEQHQTIDAADPAREAPLSGRVHHGFARRVGPCVQAVASPECVDPSHAVAGLLHKPGLDQTAV